MFTKRAGETITIPVDFSRRMISGELLSGTPTVVEIATSGLTIGDPLLNTAEWTISGKPAAISRAVLFSVAGGVAGTLYTIRVTAVTDETPAQTLIEYVQLRVN